MIKGASHAVYRWLPAVLIMVMIGVSGAALAALNHLEDRLIGSAGAALSLAASEVAGTLDLFWSQMDANTRSLARASLVQNGSLGALRRSLEAIEARSSVPLWIGVTNDQGRVLAATAKASVGDDFSRNVWFEIARAERGTLPTVALTRQAGQDGVERPVVTSASPILSEGGRFLGSIVIRVEGSVLEQLVLENVKSFSSSPPFRSHGGNALEYQVLTSHGLTVVDSDPEGIEQLGGKLLKAEGAELGQQAAQGYEEELHWRDRLPILVGYARTNSTSTSLGPEWLVRLSVKRSAIVAPVRDLGWKLGVAWCVLGLPTMGLLLWATGRMKRESVQAHQDSLRADQAEQNLSDREARTRVILDTALDALVSIDQEGRIIDWNLQAERMFGWSRAEAIGQSLSNTIIPLPYREAQEKGMRQFLATGKGPMLNRRVEVTACTRDAHEFPVELAVSPAKIGGRYVFSAFIRDITERKLRERHLAVQHAVTRVLSETPSVPEASSRLLQTLCENLGWELGNLWLVDEQTQHLRLYDTWNRRAIGKSEFLTLPRDHTIPPGVGLPGRVWVQREAIWVRDVMREPNMPRAESAAMAGLHSAFAFPVLSGDTVYGVLEFFSHEIREPGQDFLEMVADVSIRVGQFMERRHADVTLRETEEQLRQSQKMEAIGRLAGGVAHDFNNLLTVIGGYTELLLVQLGPEDRMRAEVEEIKKASIRAGALTGQLLAFSRRQARAPQLVDLNAVVLNMEEMLKRLLGEDIIELSTVRDPELSRIEADPGHLDQVLMNLAVNARDAMPNGGKLTIETSNVTIPPDAARRPGSLEPGSYVMLSMTDTGCGMSGETLAHLFEPFFTTKEKGKGTGLGLSTVYGIVRQNGGHIEVQSRLSEGSTFKIYFPRTGGVESGEVRSIERTDMQKTGETILVVEDEPGVRGLVRDMLRHHGYTVLEARDGINAQLVSKGHFGHIDLLLTDVVMPQKSGPEAAKELLIDRPEMRVLYMSGYPDHPLFSQGPLDKGKLLLQKPFTPDALVQKVRKVLDMPDQEFKQCHLVH